MRVILIPLILVGAMSSANAAGGISCSAEAGDVSISLDAGISRGMGSAMFSFASKIELRSDEVRDDLKTTEFSREHVAQYWLDGDSLKLRLYRERAGDAPHGYVEAIIETTRTEEGDDRGEYMIDVYDMTDEGNGVTEPVSFSGPITCMVE